LSGGKSCTINGVVTNVSHDAIAEEKRGVVYFGQVQVGLAIHRHPTPLGNPTS